MSNADDGARTRGSAHSKKINAIPILLVLAILASCASVPEIREPPQASSVAAAINPSPPEAETREGAEAPDRGVPPPQAPAVEPKAAPATKLVPPAATICLAGDVLLDRGIRTRIRRGVDLLEAVDPALEESDVFFFNLETSIGSAGIKVAKEFNFRGDPDFLPILVKAGNTVAGLANNHVMDYGYVGLEATLAALDERGIVHAGAGRNAEEAFAPAIITVRGIKIAFLSFGVTYPEAYYAGKNKPGIAGLDRERILLRLAEAKKAGAFAVVSLHWGMEYEDRQEASQEALARLLVDNGADCVFGHHPHVMQGIEVYKDRPIFYSVGNFVFDQWEDITTRYRLLVRLEVSESGSRTAFAPLVSDRADFVPEAPDAETFAAMIEHLRSISPAPAAIDPAKAYAKYGLRWVPLNSRRNSPEKK